ncbi:RNA polymerase subunit sigma [Pedobacter sp. Leaf216]|uniref:RNA polymerase sigma factor n=1 Tax=Pedobacter sp. Leaf216 TaxID=1735684 RepID=UPI0006FF9321|nr:sigma-70 family RNA polymerase sigma factor [Pedobacter sp. Leaf216]KQM77856.1 RNA polymerase subunit sigma [Pedobacter sp. Leaf216]
MKTATFSSMVSSYADHLRAHAMKFTRDLDDADDLVQDTLIKALRFKESFEKGSNFKGWLFVIMRNTYINDYRKKARKNSVITTEEEISSMHLYKSATTNVAENRFAMQDIQNALNNLPEAYRLPFVRYVEGYKYHEIADELEIPLGTVKTHIHQARMELKKRLKQYRTAV